MVVSFLRGEEGRSGFMGRRGKTIASLAALAALCTLAYASALRLPLIADTYLQIQLGRQWGPVEAWPELAKDALYRCRATSIVFTWWVERLFGVEPLTLKIVQVALHILATWLVFAFGSLKQIGWKLAFAAAAFFALYEGHQEAVIWFAAVPEILVFLFCLGSLLCWMKWLQEIRWRGLWLTGSLVCFVLGLLSKESAAALPILMAATALIERSQWRRIAAATVPCLLLSAVYAALIFAAKSDHLHLNDGTFSLKANVALTLINSIGRLFWFWGLVSLIALATLRRRDYFPTLAACAIWIVVTLLPYSFIAYMPRVPSRHTYLASAGLAIIVGAGFLALRERMAVTRRWVPAAVAVIIVVHNCGYLWTRKQEQYLARAAPTEELVRLGKSHKGPIFVKCFPYSTELAVMALQQRTGRSESEVIINPAHASPGAAEFCYEGN